MKEVLIIAEAGVNHNGDLDLARQLIDVASNAGANIVKFQTFQAAEIATGSAETANYQKQSLPVGNSQRDLLRGLELNFEQHRILRDHCRHRGIEFFSTAFDQPSLDLLLRLDLQRFKIPSGELTNLPFLRRIGALGKPVILSTGMANLAEIEAAIEILEQSGTSRKQITVLHCNTEYPTPMRDVNLRAMLTIRDAFGVQVGYSDHTSGIEVAIGAVALGAKVIEKHITIDRTLPGPDHAASLEPAELKEMVKAIRNIEQALGDGIKRPTSSELPNRAVARKSIVAAEPIAKGILLSDKNLTVKRPGTGISPILWDQVVGRTAHRDYQRDDFIEW